MGSLEPIGGHLIVALLGVIGVGLLVLRGFGQGDRRRRSFVLLYLLIPYSLGVTSRLLIGPSIPLARSLILISPAYFLLVALGIQSFQSYKIRVLALILLVALNCFSLYIYYTTDVYYGLREAVGYIRDHRVKGDLVVYIGASAQLPLKYYLNDMLVYNAIWDEHMIISQINNSLVERLWVVDYRGMSVTEAVVRGQEEVNVTEDMAFLERMNLTQVQELVFPGRNRVILGLYVVEN